MTDDTAAEVGHFEGERGPIPISPATAHHEAGHAMACEQFGLGWIIHGPNDDDNTMGKTTLVIPARPLPDFTLEDAVVIAMAGWAAECHYLNNWENPYVRESAEHDFIELYELEESRQGPVTDRAKNLVATEWRRVEEIAGDMLDRFG